MPEPTSGRGGDVLDAARDRLDDVDIDIMRRQFDAIDADGDGTLTSSEVGTWVRSYVRTYVRTHIVWCKSVILGLYVCMDWCPGLNDHGDCLA